MRRCLIPILLALTGCSTAPFADFLDATAPGGVGASRRPNPPAPPAPPEEFLPPPGPPPRGGGPPPLPPVPAGNSPATRNADSSAARIQPPAGADGPRN